MDLYIQADYTCFETVNQRVGKRNVRRRRLILHTDQEDDKLSFDDVIIDITPHLDI